MTNIPFVKCLCSIGRASCIVLALHLLASGLSFAASTTQILVLHSYSHEYPWTKGQHEGFVQILAADRKIHTIVSTEHLDTKRRAYDEAYARELVRHLRLKYKDYKPASIYVTDDNALLFARDHLSGLFPRTPIFFSGVNDYEVLTTLNSSIFTGVFEHKEVAPNLEWLLNMDEDANDLIFIGDGSNTYQAIEREARKDLISYRLRATFIAEKRLDRALSLMQDLPGKYLFLTTLGGMTDSNDKVLPLRDIMKNLILSGRIVISMEDAYILEGVLGGYVTSGEKQGMSAARLLLAYLHGKPIIDLQPILKSPNTLIFDDRMLQKYNINLPENLRSQATFLNPRLGIYERYRSFILCSLIGLAVLLFLVVSMSLLFMSKKNSEIEFERKQYLSIFDSIDEIIYITDPYTYEIIYVNEAIKKAFNQELVGGLCYQEFQGLDSPCHFCTNEIILKQKPQPYRWEYHNPVINRNLDIVDRIIKWPDGRDVRFELAIDITERKLAEKALLISEERLKLALDSVTDAVWDWRVDTGEVYFSSRWYTMLGYEPYELPQVFETWRKLLHPDDLPGSEAVIFQHLESALPFELEFRMRTKDNQWRWILARGKTVGMDDQGKAVRMLGTHVDITERKKMDERIQQTQKMESIGSLAGGIAHDFNNILFPIIGMSELLLEDLPPGSVERENAEEIFKAGKRGSDLVKQILAFSRQSEHKMMPTRIQNVLNEVIKLSRSTIPAYIEIEKDIQQNCGMVLADPSQIHQIGMNIITNAYHAVEDTGGKISIKLKQAVKEAIGSPGIHLSQNPYAVLSISDTGHGMSKELIGKIFDPYFTTKEQGKGTGLGLAVVYGIIKEHGGDIKVYSEIGRGSRFEIFLPLMKQLNCNGSKPEVGEYQGGIERILIVDDEAPVAKLEKKMLERLGYKVTMRLHSVEALEAFRANPASFDLVITDMSMPNIPGDHLAQKIKSIRSNVPIIICTGFSERIREENIKQMGINGLLMKPIVKSDLAKIVRKVLDETKSQNQG